MAEEVVLYEVSERIATVTLNRPEKLNALTVEMVGELAEQRRARRLDRTRKDETFGLGNRLDQRPSHAPAGAGHDQPHVGHGRSPISRGYSGTTEQRKATASAAGVSPNPTTRLR